MAFLLHRIVALDNHPVPFEKEVVTIIEDGEFKDDEEVLLLSVKASATRVHWLSNAFGGMPHNWFRSNINTVPLVVEIKAYIQSMKDKKPRACKHDQAVIPVQVRGNTGMQLLFKNDLRCVTLAFRSSQENAKGMDLSEDDMKKFKWFLDELYRDIYIYWGASLQLREPRGWKASDMPDEPLKIGDFLKEKELAQKRNLGTHLRLKNLNTRTFVSVEGATEAIQIGLKLLSEHSSCKSACWANRGLFKIKKTNEVEKCFRVSNYYGRMKRAHQEKEADDGDVTHLEDLCKTISRAVDKGIAFLDTIDGAKDQESSNDSGPEEGEAEKYDDEAPPQPMEVDAGADTDWGLGGADIEAWADVDVEGS